MNWRALKRIIACAVFCALTLVLISQANKILLNKVNNRYYMLENFVSEANEDYPVQVYGSCHAYTSFDPVKLNNDYGIASYVLANPGEIIPVTYLRMVERFKTDVPEVAVVDIWGLNAYETYMTYDEIFNSYMPVDVELIPFSLEKLEVIRDYASLDLVVDNFPIARYKDRIMEETLTYADFHYSFEEIIKHSDSYINEMTLRKDHHGFAAYPIIKNLANDYDVLQAKVNDDEKLAFEDDILKYLNKIIALCEKYDVELIFYRAPYISTENELRKANWLADYCESKGVLFLDLEKEVDFDFTYEFMDEYHLNMHGAKKATDFLATYILEACSQ